MIHGGNNEKRHMTLSAKYFILKTRRTQGAMFI